ncbi:4-hydroxyphenylacetate 3-hydroxylase family protein [Rummeliibacillus sp. SL167]|uniref:4-hydroxyphenylacetate 3-hydroxylase family protein n=1 Tax=Rummeliibacillus sp. SL167 TaxID=2579792 RepID=UPI0016471419|nr:4-hydroxyphenylacetate 3-hydroxylase N-terminal domain-containing protein [Rummeliibacillus sp. SL167]
MEKYSERLKKFNNVYLNGTRITDLPTEPAFSGSIKAIERYYDLQNENPDIHCFLDNQRHPSPISLMIPKTIEDLRKKRKSYKSIADISFGMLGRTPDFINAALASLCAHSEFLGKDRYTNYSNNAIQYYKYVKENNLFIGHGSINPQIDRSIPLGKQQNEFAGVHVIDHDTNGIRVSGAKMIVTLAPIADELLIFNMPGLKPGDEKYAVAFALPVNSSGVKIICRKTTVKPGLSNFDHPLSNSFDEMDAYLLLNQVYIPWERVFVFKNIERSNQFFDKSFIRHHTGHQDVVRAISKAELLTGIAIKLARMLKLDNFINIQEKLGDLTSSIELLKASILLSEETAQVSHQGIITPNINTIQAIRYHFPKMYAKMVQHIQSMTAGSMLATPHYQDFISENREYLMQSLSTGELDALERTQLLNLAWDVTGDSFGQRQLVYEYYHAGDPMRIAANHYLSYDKKEMLDMVNQVFNIKENIKI